MSWFQQIELGIVSETNNRSCVLEYHLDDSGSTKSLLMKDVT